MLRRYFIALTGTTLATTLLPSPARATGPRPIGVADMGLGNERQMVQIFATGQQDTFVLQVLTRDGMFVQRIQVSGDAEGTVSGLEQDGVAEVRWGDLDGYIRTFENASGAYQLEGVGPMQVTAFSDPAEDPQLAATIKVSLISGLFAWRVARGNFGWDTSTTSSGGQVMIAADPAEAAPADGSIPIPD